MNPTPDHTGPQPETTPTLTDITPVLDFYNRECSRLTLPEYIAEVLQRDCDLAILEQALPFLRSLP